MKTCSFPQNIETLATALHEHCGLAGQGKHMLPIYCSPRTADGFSSSHINTLKIQVKEKHVRLDTIIWQRRVAEDLRRQNIALPECFANQPIVYQPEVILKQLTW